MLADRIIGAFTFRRGVYAEVEQDRSFTRTAWLLVALVAFLNRLASFTFSIDWLIGVIGHTVFALFGFAVGLLVITWVGRIVFNAGASFDELVRTLGLAYVWQVMGILGILAASSTTLAYVVGPIQILAMILTLIAWFIAAREALDLAWIPTIIVVVLGWLAQTVITIFIAGLMLGLWELAGSAL